MDMQRSERTRQPGNRKRVAADAEARGNDSGAIEQLMHTEVHRVGEDASANDAARLMWEGDIGSVPVVGEGDRLIGIVTDRDIAMATYLRGIAPQDIPIRSLMTTEVISARPDDSIREVSTLMSRRQVRRVPIVDDRGVLVGIVSLNDLALSATEVEPNGGITERQVADALRAICAPRSLGEGETQLRAS